MKAGLRRAARRRIPGRRYYVQEENRVPSSYGMVEPFRVDRSKFESFEEKAEEGEHFTKLASGLRVVSQETGTYMSAIGAIVEAGSAYEMSSCSSRGAALMSEGLAWSGSLKRDQGQMLHDADMMGGFLHCQAAREQILYCVDLLRDNAEAGLEMLSESLLMPDVSQFDAVKEAVLMSRSSWSQDMIVRDLILGAAYGPDSPLGASLLNPGVTQTDFLRFRGALYTPDRIVICGTGIQHDDLVQYAQKYIEPHLPPTSHVLPKDYAVEYKPNAVMIEEAMPEVPGLAKETTEKLRIAIAFEFPHGWHDLKSIARLSLVQMILGGGDSFSAGGPGKGMYTRLYTEVLNYNTWIEAAEAFVLVHNSSSLLGISAMAHPKDAKALIQRICQSMRKLSIQHVTAQELQRAKNMLKCNVLSQLESRLILFEDLARQYATFGFRQPVADMLNAIDEVTVSDIYELVNMLTSKPPCLAAHGPNLSHLPSLSFLSGHLAP